MDTNLQRLAMQIPVDADGYLRRECPNCEREFKRTATKSSSSKESATKLLFCPYCGLQAQASRWLTKAQVKFTKNLVASHVEQRKSHIGFKSLNVSAFRNQSDVAHAGMIEPNDMTIVDMQCHPRESIKISREWIGNVRCPQCGTAHTRTN
jgi:DNA-directed RNA polymerase subunit RPC12/RpoP